MPFHDVSKISPFFSWPIDKGKKGEYNKVSLEVGLDRPTNKNPIGGLIRPEDKLFDAEYKFMTVLWEYEPSTPLFYAGCARNGWVGKNPQPTP